MREATQKDITAVVTYYDNLAKLEELNSVLRFFMDEDTIAEVSEYRYETECNSDDEGGATLSVYGIELKFVDGSEMRLSPYNVEEIIDDFVDDEDFEGLKKYLLRFYSNMEHIIREIESATTVEELQALFSTDSMYDMFYDIHVPYEEKYDVYKWKSTKLECKLKLFVEDL